MSITELSKELENDVDDKELSMTSGELLRGDVEILTGIGVPETSKRHSYPFADLEGDQCFMVECDDVKHERSIRSTATRWNNNDDGRRYIVRRIPDTESTVGVWRVS